MAFTYLFCVGGILFENSIFLDYRREIHVDRKMNTSYDSLRLNRMSNIRRVLVGSVPPKFDDTHAQRFILPTRTERFQS